MGSLIVFWWKCFCEWLVDVFCGSRNVSVGDVGVRFGIVGWF